MKLAFVPSAIPVIAEWAQSRPDDVWQALSKALSFDAPHGKSDKIGDVHLICIDEVARNSIAVGYGADFVVVFAAQAGLMLGVAEQLAERLSRTNWSQHLLCLDTSDLDRSEFVPTLTDAISAIDLTEPVRTHFEGYVREPSVGHFIEQIGIHAQPWRTSEARGDFKGLMEAAVKRPQKVDRPGGEEVYVISKRVMEEYSQPLSALELVQTFAESQMESQIPILERPTPRGVVPLVSLPDSGSAIPIEN